MTIVTVVVSCIAVVAIIILIVHFLTKNALNSALGSLLAILSSLVAAMAAPEIDGKGNLEFHLGSWASVSGQWVRINTSRPMGVWYLSFITIAALTATTLVLIYKTKTAAHP